MKVFNPINKEISLNYKGEIFTIGANTSENFKDDVAKHFVNIYQFMSIGPETKTPSPEKVEEEIKKPKKTKKE